MAIAERRWRGVEPGGEGATLRRVVQREVVDGLIDLAADPTAVVEARAAAEWSLTRIEEIAERQNPLSGDEAAHLALVLADIARFLDRTDDARAGPADFPHHPVTRSGRAIRRGDPAGRPYGPATTIPPRPRARALATIPIPDGANRNQTRFLA
jgi:hypothetical protein